MFLWYKQKTAYELRISDWTSDVCSPDLSRLSIAKSMFTPPKGVTLPEVMVGVSHCGYSVSVKSWLAAVLLLRNTPNAVSALASVPISTLAGFQYTGERNKLVQGNDVLLRVHSVGRRHIKNIQTYK